MSNLAEVSKSELAQKYQSALNRARSMKREMANAAKVGTNSMLVAGGGAIAGALAVKMAKIPGTEIKTDVALGTALVAAAAFDLLDGFGDQAAAVGSGMLAVAAARSVQQYLVSTVLPKK